MPTHVDDGLCELPSWTPPDLARTWHYGTMEAVRPVAVVG
jgi:hypothetical protein